MASSRGYIDIIRALLAAHADLEATDYVRGKVEARLCMGLLLKSCRDHWGNLHKARYLDIPMFVCCITCRRAARPSALPRIWPLFIITSRTTPYMSWCSMRSRLLTRRHQPTSEGKHFITWTAAITAYGEGLGQRRGPWGCQRGAYRAEGRPGWHA